MTLSEIKGWVDDIKRLSNDDERAHGSEDELYRTFITFLSEHENPYQERAKEILKTKDINFKRWCA